MGMSFEPRAINSLVLFRNSSGDESRGTLIKLTRTTLILEVYNPYSIVQLSEVLHNVEVRRSEQIIYRGRVVVNNLVNTGLMLIVSTTLLDPWLDLVGLVGKDADFGREIRDFISEWDQSSNLRPGFRIAVTKMRSLMIELHKWLEQIELTKETDNNSSILQLTDDNFQELAEPVLERMSLMLDEFEHEADHISEESKVNHKRFAQNDLHPLILRAPFVHRSFYKPLGYAGDYEMVNMMLREARQGPTIYTQIINKFCTNLGPAVAHRNRIELIQDWLRDGFVSSLRTNQKIEVISVGCGPAFELQRLNTKKTFETGNYHFDLLDFNLETLEVAQKEVAEIAGSNEGFSFNSIHQSVHALLKQSSRPQGHDARGAKYDFVYCAGLFDYLSDKVCSRLLKLFYSWLKPAGRVLATNVHTNNSHRWSMEYLLEWHLIYRDEPRMRSLASGLGVQRCYQDATGINVFLEIKKWDSKG